jgi:hypothetical protein
LGRIYNISWEECTLSVGKDKQYQLGRMYIISREEYTIKPTDFQGWQRGSK